MSFRTGDRRSGRLLGGVGAAPLGVPPRSAIATAQKVMVSWFPNQVP